MILRLILLFLLLTANKLAAKDKMTLLLDWFINPDHGPIIIAKEKGYFSDQNLEIEIIAPADPSAPPLHVTSLIVALALN